MLMLAKVVEYLRSNGVPFRLLSYAASEPEPRVAHRSPETLAVDTHVVLIDGRASLACLPRGEKVNIPGLLATLHARFIEEQGARDVLPWPFGSSAFPIPPLGRMLGAPLFVDQALLRAPILCFEAFSRNDFLELTFDDFARLERPRVEAVAVAGELPAASPH
jgi:prolyl-tRNA editing enzyme YbaK/EbsC (Cys-tRNA(Pro) deacylase)